MAGVGKIGDELWAEPKEPVAVAAALFKWCECEFKNELELWWDFRDVALADAFEDDDDLLFGLLLLVLLLLLLFVDLFVVLDEEPTEAEVDPLPLLLPLFELFVDVLRFVEELEDRSLFILKLFDCCCCCCCWRHLALRFLNQTCKEKKSH